MARSSARSGPMPKPQRPTRLTLASRICLANRASSPGLCGTGSEKYLVRFASMTPSFGLDIAKKVLAWGTNVTQRAGGSAGRPAQLLDGVPRRDLRAAHRSLGARAPAAAAAGARHDFRLHAHRRA